MKICGIDPSLNATGFAQFTDLEESVLTLAGVGRNEGRLYHLGCILAEKCQGADLVVIEGLSFAARSTSAHELAGLHWVLRVNLWFAEIPFVVVAPTSLKKFATGKGNAPKEVVMMDVSRRWGIRPDDSNQADAYVLAKIGACFLKVEEPLTKGQIEVMAKISGVTEETKDFKGSPTGRARRPA